MKKDGVDYMYGITHKELQEINPYIRMCRYTETSPGWALTNRIIYDHQLVLVVKGIGETIIADNKYKSVVGNLYLIKPGIVHSFIANDENPFEMMVVHFDFFYEKERNFWPHKKFHLDEGKDLPEKHLLRDVPMFGSTIFPDNLPINNYSAVEVLMKKMIDIYKSEVVGKEILLKAYLLEILFMVYTALEENKAIASSDSGFEKIKKAFDYINENYEYKINVQELAALCNLSSNYFAGLFKQQTGYAPNEYVIRVRIEKAKQLLAKSQYTVSEISEKIGFGDIHYFSYYFKKIEGMSPSQYRQSAAVHTSKMF
jgi:AraC-like DNA-binding protein